MIKMPPAVKAEAPRQPSGRRSAKSNHASTPSSRNRKITSLRSKSLPSTSPPKRRTRGGFPVAQDKGANGTGPDGVPLGYRLLEVQDQRGSEHLRASAKSGEHSSISDGEYSEGCVRLLLTRDVSAQEVIQLLAELRRAGLRMLEMIGNQGRGVEILLRLPKQTNLKDIFLKFR